jgi:membrane protease YdiL (CAAX protease family)
MTSTGGFEPDSQPSEPQFAAEPSPLSADPAPSLPGQSIEASPTDPIPAAQVYSAWPTTPNPFESWATYTEPPVRTPHFGHLAVLALLLFIGVLASSLLIHLALHFHLYGVTTITQAMTEIHYTLASEVVLYLVTLAGCLLVLPFIWHRSFFSGIQWNAPTALRKRNSLFAAAFACFIIALINGVFMPGPENAPIDKIFRAPGAAWLLFAFGVTFAPFFEELFFRGFLLPALCTACDWIHERVAHVPPLLPDENDHPRWTLPAMIIGSVATSLPFALMHAAQTGYSVGPLILLVGVSLVLCWTRLATRSLAASILVHASYNFLLFSFMMLGTEGFRHLDKM